MKDQDFPLTLSAPTVALSRRAFMHGVGGVTLSLVLSLHDANAVTLSQNAPTQHLVGAGRPALGSSAAKGDLLQIPFWADAATWNRPEYYETIQAGRRPFNKTVQSADIDGDGCDELLVRGLRGIFANRFDPNTGQWIQLPNGPAWDDAGGWNRAQYRQSMQTADIDGDGQAELLSLGNPTLYITEYHPASSSWVYFPPGPALDTNGIMEQPQYYQTMQCADIDGDGQDELLVRGPDGMHVWKIDPVAKSWKEEANVLSTMSDANFWNLPKYYETLQCADVDGDGAAELLGRAGDGLYVWKFDPVAKSWKEASLVLPTMSDVMGWYDPHFYSTIQCADIDGDGAMELLGLVPYDRSATATSGISCWKYDKIQGVWNQMGLMGPWRDLGIWGQNFPTYETIQCADIDGDGQAELLGRVGSGIEVFKYDPRAQVWNQLPDGPAWSDANNWNQVQYYSTIQTARALKPGDPGYTGDGNHTQSVLIGRASQGMQTYRYDSVAKQWVNPSLPFPTFTGDQGTAYNYLTTLLEIQNVGAAGIRGSYNIMSAPLTKWMDILYNSPPLSYEQMPRPSCSQPPPPGVTQTDWDAVTWQIYWELVWVANVQNWYGNLSVTQMNSTFLGESLTLDTVGQYLQYSTDNGWQIALSILALMGGAMAAVLGQPELEAGVAAAVIGVLSNAISTASGLLPGGGGGFQAQYNQLQSQLRDAFTAMATSLGTTQYAITGGNGGNGYVPGDYGLLKAIGQMIESTVWNWPSNTLNLVAAMQRGYAQEVFKVLFTAYQANSGYYNSWLQVEDKYTPDYYPADYPITSSLYTTGRPIRWLTYYSNSNIYAPEATLKDMFNPPQTGTVFPLGISTTDFYLAQNGWPQMSLYDKLITSRPPLPPSRPPSLSADMRVSATLTRDPATNQLVATLTVKNMGIGGATNVEIVETSLNRKRPLANLSRRRTHLVQGRSQVYTVNFPSLAQGATAILKVSGRYKGGSFGGSFRIKIP